MAEEIEVGGGARAKLRNPLGVVGLALITIGIYYFFWWYYINREMAEYGKAKGSNELGDSPGKSVLAITLGAIIIVPWVLSTINTFRRVQTAQKMAGVEQLNGWIGLILIVVLSPAFYAYMQSGLNSAWRAEAQQSQPEQAVATQA